MGNLPEDTFHPCHDFVTGRIGGLVQVDDTGADVRLEVTAQGGGASRNRGEVTGTNEHYGCGQCRLVKNGDWGSIRFS